MIGDKTSGKSPLPRVEHREPARPPALGFGKCGTCNAPVGGSVTSKFVTHVTCSLCKRPTCLVCMRLRRARPICKGCDEASQKKESAEEEHVEDAE